MVFLVFSRHKRRNLYYGVYLALHMEKIDLMAKLNHSSPKKCKRLVWKIVKNKFKNRSKRQK